MSCDSAVVALRFVGRDCDGESKTSILHSTLESSFDSRGVTDREKRRLCDGVRSGYCKYKDGRSDGSSVRIVDQARKKEENLSSPPKMKVMFCP
jgi:hypothetical protein